MGQKGHPYGLRLGYIKPWKARWYAKRGLAEMLDEDLQIRKYVKSKLSHAGIANIEIERSGGRVRVRIFSARPGVIIGRRGQEIDKVRDDLAKIAKKELFIDIKEVKNPQIDAQLVAENIALQLVKRIGFRRAMKKTLQAAMMKGALGIKVQCKGRLGGADIARTEKYHAGSVPLSTFRADIDYGFAEANTTYGAIGCKVWIYKGDILVKKEEAEQRAVRQKEQEDFERKLAQSAQIKAAHEGGQAAESAVTAVAEEPVKEEAPKADKAQAPEADQKEEGKE